MNAHELKELKPADRPHLIKSDAALRAFVVAGRRDIAIRAGTLFNGRDFAAATPLPLPDRLEAGCDYAVQVTSRAIAVVRLDIAPTHHPDCLGGFHFAPGGNGPSRSGGDSEPAINPCSLWDLKFRPACDPRGMTFVDTGLKKFWCDIYLTGADHLVRGTSAFGVTIADGNDPPSKPGGGRFKNFDYETAAAVMAHHGKGLLGLDEFFAAAYGVTEKTVCARDPKITGLDAARTSRFGLMQATGSMWTLGHDGDPDVPRASIVGGSWLLVGVAGSRCAVVDFWPGDSTGFLGARGRCDHLQPE